jgi:hypothetical protein
MYRLLPLVVLAGCPQPGGVQALADVRPDRDAGSPIGAGPAVPLDTAVEYPQPVLMGDRTALDLKSLVRSKLDYDLTMETSVLSELDADDAEALLVHLAADPRWRVYNDGSVLVAARRSQDRSGDWTVSASGYHDDDGAPWRILLRFDGWPAAHPWATSELVARAKASAGRAHLGGFVPANSVYEGNVITAMSVESDLVSLDVYESGPQEARPRTAAALSEVPPLVYNAQVLGDRLRKSGHERLMLPKNEPSRTGTSVELVDAGAGQLDWRARVNPGEPGWVWLRITDGDQAWDEVNVASGTREASGWSSAPDAAFFAQSRFTAPAGPAFDATAEVWFLPTTGDARELARVPVRVPAR